MKPKTDGVLTRSALIDQVALRTSDLTKKQTGVAVSRVLSSIADALCGGKRVELRGFGVLYPKVYEPRKGINPSTGESIDLPHIYTVRFKPGQQLRHRVNDRFKRLEQANEPVEKKD